MQVLYTSACTERIPRNYLRVECYYTGLLYSLEILFRNVVCTSVEEVLREF